ncbi:hypothetical protein MGN01_41660 [Methylobacterium gnaphalii]|uniref:Uncharacterized protein n=1 Tax=Methylobacterium gnaphalii TaxID=1010610 RepID=A0A512JQW1_9HYPH|nr:hypothetical protein MGN01_41660 [Methylobacterium gnaphalii]GLS50896.1 hypothetical protein GCM10007885_37500 [Methylobacterium gnaphalii]
MATLSTAHDAAIPDSKAVCAAPTVDFGPMNSDISKIPITTAGTERAAVMKSEFVFDRKWNVRHVVIAM